MAAMGKVEVEIERVAKRVLVDLLGGHVEERDRAGVQGVRDFDLVDDDRAVRHAVEVTSVQLPSARATRSGIEHLGQEELGLTASWNIYVHEEAVIQPIRKKAPALLNLLSTNGITEFDEQDPPDDQALAHAVATLSSLTIPKGRVMPRVSPARLYLDGFGSGPHDPANLTIAVEAEAHNSGNRKKLAAAPNGAIRHLFVWLHDSHWNVSVLLRSWVGMPPAPALPPEIDVIWAAVGDGPEALTCTALLRGDADGWTQVDPASG